MQTIYLDISNKGVVPTVYAKQGDVGRKFEVVLTDSGLPYVPNSGSAFSVWYSGTSGEGNYTNIGDKSAFSVNGNKVTVEMIVQMLSNDGDGVLSLALNDPNGNQISTWNIPYCCESVPGAESEEAKSYYTAFSQAVENLPYPDTSLSVVGKAADAAAVGAALNGKAPAGYGLGTVARNIAQDLDTVVENGWYCYNKDACTNTPENVPSMLLVENFYNTNYCKQTVTTLTGTIYIRIRNGGNWYEWGCVNPPMLAGVEYRTTERWKGKAVYTKLVDFGTLPNTGTKTINVGINGGKWYELHGHMAHSNGNHGVAIPSSDCGIYIDEDGVLHLTTQADCSVYSATIALKYIKD